MKIRPMTGGDSAAVSDVHLASFPGFFLSSLGSDFLRIYYRGVCLVPNGIAYVSEDETGRVSGFAAGAVDPRRFYRFLISRQWLGFGLASLWAAGRKPSIVPRLLGALSQPSASPQGPEVAGLFSLGVHPGRQGKGTGRALVSEFCSEAIRRGARRVFLTTDALDNDPVNEFYQRCGFALERQHRTRQGRLMNEYWVTL